MTAPPRPRVGVIGVGRIGQPIVGHLRRRRFEVTAHDSNPARQATVEAAGAQWSDTVGGVARAADVVLVLVGYDHEVRAVVAEELCQRASPDTIVTVLSTIHPRTVQELSDRVRPFGLHLLDATLCRGGHAADEGTLLSFVAGTADQVERLTPILACFCTDIVPTGTLGSAQVAKAANNLLMWACLVANHEALALAKRWGVDVDALRAALLKTGARNGVLQRWGTSTMTWADDDLEIIQRMADDVGIALPQAGLNRELCRMLKPKKFRLEDYGV